jgi:hypothetical protein
MTLSLPSFQKGREVAQAGSAPGLGPGGRRFESCLPDIAHHSFSDGGLFISVDFVGHSQII